MSVQMERWIAKNPGIIESYEKEDTGWWVYLTPGLICRPMGCGVVHEYNLPAVFEMLKEVQKGEQS
tara:strand:- start:326 stop:523 length:198 start_codon:yes stop_codon:yes gene_type:complete